MKILYEANEAAVERIRKKFPKLPQEFMTLKEPIEARIPVALTETGWDIINSSKMKGKRKRGLE